MCDFCNFANKQHGNSHSHPISREITDRLFDEWSEDDYEDDPRCDFEKDPSLANGWFFNL